MATSYPGGYDSLPRPTASDTMNDTAGGLDGPAVIDNISDAIEAIETELGTDPAGAYATVAARLTAIAAASSSALSGFYDVKDATYGAVGDDTNDDTAEIQAALTAGAGAIVYFPEGTYKISSALTVSAGTTITGPGTIHQITSGAVGLNVTGSNVTIEKITLQGRHASAGTYTSGEDAIDVTAASLAASYENITIRDVTIHLWGRHGIYFRYVSGFSITGCNIYDCGYSGMMILSSFYGDISGNRIDNIDDGTTVDLYGIALSALSPYGSTDPSTSDVVVSNNVVSNIAWEGIDSHGGSRLVISDNVVLNCTTAITVFGGDDYFCPHGVVVTGNYIDSLSDDVPAASQSSILIWGLEGALAPPQEDATGVLVANNVIRRSTSITFGWTDGVTITGNIFDACYYRAIYMDAARANNGFTITDNTFIDTWRDSGSAYSIYIGALAGNTGTISGNTVVRGAKSATSVNTYGMTIGSGASVQMGVNNWAGATTPISGTGMTLGFYGTQGVAKPTVTGAKASNAALGSLLTALADLGLITDSSST